MNVLLRKTKTAGHILVTTLVIAGVLGIAVAAYLHLFTGQINFTARSQVWNDCLYVAEAGIEEAMAHINQTMCTNLSQNGWSWDSGRNAFTKTRNLGDKYATISIFTNASFPYVIAHGFVPAPVTVARGGPLVAAVGPTPGQAYISRTVKVTTKREGALSKGLVVKLIIDFNGNNVLIDSYDSEVAPYSPATAGDKGDVFSNADALGCISIGNADIKGHITTGPNADVKAGPNSRVGSVDWFASGNSGIEPGWWRKDANLYIPDVSMPWAPGTASTPGPMGGYKYVLGSGRYELNAINLSSSEQMYINGNATLWVKGAATITGTVKMEGPDSRLTIYLGGNGNITGEWIKSIHPKDLMVFGLPTCKAIVIGSASQIEAVVYAPQADVRINGNGQFLGAITGNSARLNGVTGFHYDESLGRLDLFRPYRIGSWQEL